MKNKIWNYKKQGATREEITGFAQQFNLNPIIVAILFNRGITTPSAVRIFLEKRNSSIHSPLDLCDMDKAVARVYDALKNNEKIVIYGDYDADGITSTVLLYTFLKEQGADVSYYIPDRNSEGYGINIIAINKFAKEKVNLVITVDCGITSIGEVEFAKTQNLDMVILDHHTCRDELPRAVAAVDPKRPDCDAEFKDLAGVGVALKFVLALTMEMGKNTTDVFKRYAELTAIGTISDVVPLLDENRIIVERGLDSIKSGGNIGVSALLKVSGADARPITASTIAFSIAPRINASGRMGTAETAVKLLLSDNHADAEKLANELDSINRNRQVTEQEIFKAAEEQIANDAMFDKKQIVVIAGEDWHHGVIGIVAARICEKYYKPCILISHSNGVGKGSGRSIPGFNLYDALDAVSEHLTTFGGHSGAAGIGINMSEIDKFTTAINNYAKKILTPEDMIPKVNIDCKLRPESITLQLAKSISLLEPFGMNNETPIFSVHGVTIAFMDTVGIDSKHLRLKVSANGVSFNAIGFNMAEYAPFFRVGDLVDLAFSLDINNYQGNQTVQLLVKDIKKHSNNL